MLVVSVTSNFLNKAGWTRECKMKVGLKAIRVYGLGEGHWDHVAHDD